METAVPASGNPSRDPVDPVEFSLNFATQEFVFLTRLGHECGHSLSIATANTRHDHRLIRTHLADIRFLPGSHFPQFYQEIGQVGELHDENAARRLILSDPGLSNRSLLHQRFRSLPRGAKIKRHKSDEEEDREKRQSVHFLAGVFGYANRISQLIQPPSEKNSPSPQKR